MLRIYKIIHFNFTTLNLRNKLLSKNIYVKYSLSHGLLGYIWLLSTFVNSSCDIIKIVQNCCRNWEVRGLICYRKGPS